MPLAVLIAAIGAADGAARPTPWRSRWAVWLGETSFAFYMVHQLAIRLVVRSVGQGRSTLVEAAATLAGLILAISASWLLYRLVEVPCLRRLTSGRWVAAAEG